jgi:hypothetical protein
VFCSGTNAANLSGTLADARLSANVPLIGSANVFTQTQRAPAFSASGTVTAAAFAGPTVSTPAAPTITTSGAAGSSTWTYTVVAMDSYGNPTAASAGGSTTTGNATLTGSNYNVVSWSAVTGATKYLIYRTAHATSPTTNGLIGYALASPFNDTGLTGDGTTAPTANATGIARSYLDVTDSPFGGVCDGTTDDAPAFRLAYASAMASGKQLHIPASAAGCKIGSTLNFANTTKFTMVGDTACGTSGSTQPCSKIVVNLGTFTFTDSLDVIYFNATGTTGGGVVLKNFGIDNPSTSNGNGTTHGIVHISTVNNLIENVVIQHGNNEIGLFIDNSYNTVRDSTFSLNQLNFKLSGSCTNLFERNLFTNGLGANGDPTQGYEMQATGSTGAVQNSCVNTFINNEFDESGTVISFGANDIWNFTGGRIQSGQDHYALRLLKISGQVGGRVNLNGVYVGPWSTTACGGSSCGGLDVTNANGTYIASRGSTFSSLNNSGGLYSQPVIFESLSTGSTFDYDRATTLTGTPDYSFASAVIPMTGTTGSIGGGALGAGACTSGTVTITGAATTMSAQASPNTYPGDGIVWNAQVTSANTVTVKVCAITALTPTASTYNVRVTP